MELGVSVPLRCAKRDWAVPTMRQSGVMAPGAVATAGLWQRAAQAASDGQRRLNGGVPPGWMTTCNMPRGSTAACRLDADLQRVEVEKHAEVAADLHAPHALPSGTQGQVVHWTGLDFAASPCPPRPLLLAYTSGSRTGAPKAVRAFVSRVARPLGRDSLLT